MRGWCVLTASALVVAGSTADAGPSAAFEKYRASVVAVNYYVETSIMREVREIGGRDLGLLVAPDLVLLNGSIVTSSSTGAQPHDFRVMFVDGSEADAVYVGRDEFANLAFLRLEEAVPARARPIQFGKAPKLRVGDPVFTLGLLPENLQPIVRLQAGRVVAAVDRPKPFIVTDLAVARALGGPVFTADGAFAGVLSELGEAGPSFAQSFGGDGDENAAIIIDAATVQRLTLAPPRRGQSQRAWLGITLQALDKDMAEYWGLGDNTGGIIINSVMPGSPAEQAGLREGDLVLHMNGEPVPVSEEEHVPIFVEQIGSHPVGSRLKLDVLRAGKHLEANIDLVAAPKSRLDAATYHNDEFELTVRELVFQDYRSFDLKPDFKGALVSRVEEGGWAGVGGLESGDILQKLDDRAITSPDDVKQVLEAAAAEKRKKLVFFVQRGGRTQFITVQPNWSGSS